MKRRTPNSFGRVPLPATRFDRRGSAGPGRKIAVYLCCAAAVFFGYRLLHRPESPVVQEEITQTVHAAIEQVPVRRVGLQIGHWKNDELPDELEKLYWNTGAAAGGYDEWEVCLEIAQKVAADLGADGVEVDLLPATVPPSYKADAFIALHADGNDLTEIYGWKLSPSHWDTDGNSALLSGALAAAYGEFSGMVSDSEDAISDDMTEYYAFNYQRYQHAVAATTPAVLFELGYLTNPNDRYMLTVHSDRIANALATGIRRYLDLTAEQ